MTGFDHEQLPDDLSEVDARLKAHRTEVTPLELDEIKLRTMGRAFPARTSRYGRQYLMRSKFVTLALVLGLVVSGGAAGVIATGGGGGGGNASQSEYKPGKGCGDKNHQHDREAECLVKPGKPPK
jgi:hypothetical protein